MTLGAIMKCEMYKMLWKSVSSRPIIKDLFLALTKPPQQPMTTISKYQSYSVLSYQTPQQKRPSQQTTIRRNHITDCRNPVFSGNIDDTHSFLKSLPWQFLRAADSRNFDETTHQRNNVPYDLHTGKPELTNTHDDNCNNKNNNSHLSIDKFIVNEPDGACKILWSDGAWTVHNDIGWLEQQYNLWKNSQREDRIFWTNLTETHIRESTDMSMSFDELITEDGPTGGMSKALKALYRYGILLVTDTPTDDKGAGIAALGAAVSGGTVKNLPSTSILANYRAGGSDFVLPDATDGPLRTLYGSVWATSSSRQPDGTSVADSAYGSDGLPLHTDFTYQTDPPGLQIFTMVQPALSGGESVFGDGFAVAEALRESNPSAFDILSKTVRTYHSRDEVTGWHLKASGTVIQVKHGRIAGIRHNDLDRLPDLPPYHAIAQDDLDAFYRELKNAHDAWDTLLAQDKFRLVMNLAPGDTIVVANQRCFHGRKSFQSSMHHPRIVMGCYVSQDELYSRFRMEGYDV